MQSFTCGRCAGCISKQRTDWRVRAFYEALGCLQTGGYVLFDTLTYCDDYIKRYSDIFPEMSIPQLLDKHCFSRADVQKFFKRLRISLKRAGYKYDSKELRYILTSEYGSSEKTKGFINTHRPHYHVLFFVGFDIKPVEFSRYVSRAWQLGKTDGVRPYDDCVQCPLKSYCKGNCLYQSAQYVENERIVRNDSDKNCLKCVNYVTKYISKDMYMSSELQNRVDTLWRVQFPEFQKDILLYRKYRRFCSQVLPFHLQSQGFGAYLLQIQEVEYSKATNKVHLPTSDKNVIRSVTLPRYYQRKLYYTFEKIDGRVQWYLTDYGVDTKVNQLDNKIRSFEQDFRAYDTEISDNKLHDLAIYSVVYRGALADRKSLCMPYKSFYRDLIKRKSGSYLYINRNTHKDKMTCGKFLSTSYKITDDGEILYKGKQLHSEFIPYDGYFVIDDKLHYIWSGFDKCLSDYARWCKDVALSRDAVQYVDDVNRDYYKRIGLLNH